MKQLIWVVVLLSLLNIKIFAQGERAVPFLAFQTSLPLIGAGKIGVAKPNNDPIGYYLNPAILGYSSQNNHLSLFFMPNKVDWMHSLNLGLTKNTYGFNLGYNFKELGFPISIGFGYMHDTFDYGTFNTRGVNTTNGFNPYDSFDVLSLGIGVDYYLLFNFGISIKQFDSFRMKDLNIIGNGTTEYRAEDTAFDYGVMIITPISKLLFNDVKYEFCNTSYIKPIVNFTLGYAIANIGDEISYFDEAQLDPLSRTGRLGYTFDFGIDAHLNNTKINLFSYSFTAEVEDILIKQKFHSNIRGIDHYEFDGYQSLFGDIDIWDNMVLLSKSDKVVLHKGHTLNLFETLTLTAGSFSGYTTVETIGYGFSSEGILKIASAFLDNKILQYFSNHFVIEYYDVTLFKNFYNLDTYMQGVSLHMRNIKL